MSRLAQGSTHVTTRARHARCLRSSAGGTVTIIFAAAAVPIVMLTGLAFSFGFATVAKEQLDLAADTAALAAASTAARSFTAGQSAVDSNGQPDYINQGNAAGVDWFQNQAAVVLGSLSTPTETVNVTQNGGTFSATVSYTANIQTILGNWFGTIGSVSTSSTSKQTVKGLPEANTASVTITTNAYVDVDFLLDNSSSMMIGATETDIQRLGAMLYQVPNVNLPPSAAGLQNYPCAFACHWTQPGTATDYYAVARAANPPITLRWDVLQSAMQTAIAQMETQEVVPNQYQIGVFSFGDPATAPLKTIYPDGSTNVDGAKAVVAANTSPVVIDAANTDFPSAMAALSAATTIAGDGSTPAQPKKALIIITDGIADYNPRVIPTSEGPMDPADCQAMKDKGYQVFVLYTTYSTDYPLVLLFNQGLANFINATGPGSLSGNLQACASSPQDFIQASSPADIQAGLSQLLSIAVGNAATYTQ